MIATTIKREYLDRIISGERKIEYRERSGYWISRVEGKLHKAILFISGKQIKAFHVTKIIICETPPDLKHIISTYDCYAIHLGGGLALAEARETMGGKE